jgi:hypothetical protein
MSLGDRIAAQIRSNGNGNGAMLPQMEPNPLQKAYDDYREMERDRNEARHEASELRIHNGALMAEVAMLREALERSDADRIRLQAIASTFVGGVRSLNAVAADLYKLAIKNGLEAAEAAKPEEKAALDQAGAEAREIFDRVPTSLPDVRP